MHSNRNDASAVAIKWSGRSYIVQRQDGRCRRRKSKKDVVDHFGVIPDVLAFARSNANIEITKEFAAHWGLLDNAEGRDGSGGDEGAEEDWEIARIMFDPDMGMDEDEEKGGFKAKCGGRGSRFPMQLFTLAFAGENEDEEIKWKVAPDLWRKHGECVKNPGKWFKAK